MLLIVGYHLFIGRVSGGVDVLFALSGFFVTLMLLNQADLSGRVHPLRFAARVGARLLPALTVVLIAVAVAVVVLLPPWRRASTLGEIAWAATFNESWALSVKSVDYLSQSQPASPVQHLWALSLQARFYVIWLVVFGFAAVMGRWRDIRLWLVIVMVPMFIGSLAYSIVLTSRNQPQAYFNAGARLWEFAAGGLLAVTIPFIARARWRGAGLVGWIGLVLVASCGAVLTVSRSFPGWIALWPVLGALAVVASAYLPASAKQSGPSRALSSRWLVFVGGVSFALYLWHWPILVFYRSRVGEGSVGLLPGVLIVACSLALAVATTRLAELPIRTWAASIKRPLVAVLLALLAVAVVAVPTWGASRIEPRQVKIPDADHPGAMGGTNHAGGAGASYFAPDPVLAAADFPTGIMGGCESPWGASRGLSTCEFGESQATVDVLLVGGSHSVQWIPALVAVALKQGWHLISAAQAACRFTLSDAEVDGANDACAQANDALVRRISESPPDLIVTTSTISSTSGDEVPDGYLQMWRMLADRGIPVVAIRDTPRWSSNPLDCLSENAARPEQCYVARGDTLNAGDPTIAISPRPSGVAFVDFSDILCRAAKCPAVIGNVTVYMDDDHLTSSFVRTMASVFAERVVAAAGRSMSSLLTSGSVH